MPDACQIGLITMVISDRLRFQLGAAAQLPYPDGTFDLVVTTTSFDHWADQRTGLHECARVLVPGGHLGPRRPVLGTAVPVASCLAPRQDPDEGPRRPPARGGRVSAAAME